MTALVKICGLSSSEAVKAALDHRAAFIGFVFFEKSSRYVRPEAAAQLASPARRSGVKTVAVTVDPSDERLEWIMAGFGPDYIQLHGKETPARVVDVRRRTGVEVIKAASVAAPSDIADAVRQFDAAADHIMFDASPPRSSDVPGGHGLAFDWDWLDGLRLQRPWFLAGGLDPWNVADALKRTRAPMVDVSSGVERGPGLKDPALISALSLRRARSVTPS